jgi:hypothetical protein
MIDLLLLTIVLGVIAVALLVDAAALCVALGATTWPPTGDWSRRSGLADWHADGLVTPLSHAAEEVGISEGPYPPRCKNLT